MPKVILAAGPSLTVPVSIEGVSTVSPMSVWGEPMLLSETEGNERN